MHGQFEIRRPVSEAETARLNEAFGRDIGRRGLAILIRQELPDVPAN